MTLGELKATLGSILDERYPDLAGDQQEMSTAELYDIAELLYKRIERMADMDVDAREAGERE